MKKKTEPRIPVNAYLPQSQADTLRAIADSESRSLANLVSHIVRQWLDARLDAMKGE